MKDNGLLYGDPPLVIAEVGINHNGEIQTALECIDVFAAAGAGAVKFQSYEVEDFVTDLELTYSYESNGQTVTETQRALFERCQLSRDDLAILKQRCDDRGVAMLSTPTSTAGVDELRTLGAPMLKNGSDFLTHIPLLEYMAATGLPTLVSVGMATMAEVRDAVDVFDRAGARDQLVLLQCTSAYPTPHAQLNLRRLVTLREEFGLAVGFSDHSVGTTAACVAVGLGAVVVEKHVTLDRNLPGPDHHFSSEPDEFAQLVAAVEESSSALGSPDVAPTPLEVESRRDFRLSCVAVHDLPVGHVLAESDIAFSRPGTGVAPKHVGDLVGRTVKIAISVGSLIDRTNTGPRR